MLGDFHSIESVFNLVALFVCDTTFDSVTDGVAD